MPCALRGTQQANYPTEERALSSIRTHQRQCDGSPTGKCPHAAIWSVRLTTDPDHALNFSCGRHLHYHADYLTGGERTELDLRRIICDER